jgi:hypothetical protein
MAYQNASQSVYVPSSDSDLYNNKKTVVSRPVDQPYQQLFVSPSFKQGLHPNLSNSSIGADRFFNSTRTQLRQVVNSNK